MNVLDRALVEAVAQRLRADPGLIEKDWHVTRVLQALAALDHGGASPAFGGGTSLSKGWGLIKRFSEDIDFKVTMPARASRSQVKKARSVYRERVLGGLTAAGFVVGDDVLKRDESSFFSAALFYPALFDAGRGLRPHIQIEMSLQAAALPSRPRSLGSLIALTQNQAPEIESFLCVDPVETAADKLSALGLVYASDRLRWIDRYASLAGILDRYAPRLGWRSAMPGAVPSPVPGQTRPTQRPPSVPAVKIPDVSSFVGIDDVKEELNRLITSRVIQGAHLPATLIALIGPRGTGKSSMALHLASQLSRSGALSSDRGMLSPETLPGIGDGGAGPEVMQAVTSQANAALGGVLLIEDLDWLASASSGQTATDLGARLLNVARSNPRKLFIIATGSPEAFGRLDPDKRWLGQFNVIPVSFPHLREDALAEIFLQALKAEKLTLDPSASRALENKIADMKKESGESFQNAHAMGQLVGAILARLPRDRHDVTPRDIRDAPL